MKKQILRLLALQAIVAFVAATVFAKEPLTHETMWLMKRVGFL